MDKRQAKRRLHRENIASAIISKAQGVDYEKVIADHHLTPNQFEFNINRWRKKLPDIDNTSHLEKILSDENTVENLFKMSEEYIRSQYKEILGGRQLRYHRGTLMNGKNRRVLAYISLTHHYPVLLKNDRKEVIECLQKLPGNLHDRLTEIKLDSLMLYGTDKIDSPLAVIELFDQEYQRRTGDVSVFDLDQPIHIHKWGNSLSAPASYWHSRANITITVYHLLVEGNIEIQKALAAEKPDRRHGILAALRQLPSSLYIYYKEIGMDRNILDGVNRFRDKQDLLTTAVLKFFDEIYVFKFEDKSLFDTSQESYLKIENSGKMSRNN